MPDISEIIKSFSPLGSIVEQPDAIPPDYLLLHDFQQVSLCDSHSKDLCYNSVNQELILQGKALMTDRFVYGWEKLDYEIALKLNLKGAYRHVAARVKVGDAFLIRTGQGYFVKLRIEHLNTYTRTAIAYREFLDPQAEQHLGLTVVLDSMGDDENLPVKLLRVITLRKQKA